MIFSMTMVGINTVYDREMELKNCVVVEQQANES